MTTPYPKDARITFTLSEDGSLDIWLNQEGRDRLVSELLRLDEAREHFHISPDDWSEIKARTTPYRASDRVLDHGKVYFRKDEWDLEHFPHVLPKASE